VALHRILVVDDSPAVRETVGILLGGEYDVHSARLDDYTAKGLQGPLPSLIIATRTAVRREQPTPFPGGIPVLWIDSPSEGPGGGWQGPSIPRRFSPRELRRSVAELLATPAAVSSAPAYGPRLQPPYVTREAARAIGQALGTDLPLHLVGEAGTGKRAVARAVHGARGGGPFLPLAGGHFDAAVLATPGRQGGTLFIDHAEQLSAPAQQALLGVLEPTGLVRLADGAGVRLISATTADLGEALDGGRFAPDLYYGMTMLTVRLTALRERPDDIPALAQMLVGELAVLLGRAPMVLTDRALDRLANYLWFGNLAELEAVLARTAALCRDTVIDVDDLLFDGARLGPARNGAAAAPREGRTALGGRPLDLIINELAHEFKNPLVTIKTFAHQLRRAKSGGGDGDQVARLTSEAVAQIDQTLENLLEFTRLETPVPQSIPLSAVLNPVLGECAEALATRGVALEHPPAPPVTVRGDPQQLAYAMTNLVRALTRELAPSSRLAVRYAPPALLSIELPNGINPLSSHLATLLDRPSDGSPDLPLGVAIANAVFERNGAQIALADDTPSTVTVRFTPADDEGVVAGNGTAPRPSR
jgi:signal transduction histidine kinase